MRETATGTTWTGTRVYTRQRVSTRWTRKSASRVANPDQLTQPSPSGEDPNSVETVAGRRDQLCRAMPPPIPAAGEGTFSLQLHLAAPKAACCGSGWGI